MEYSGDLKDVTILILIDGFLQYIKANWYKGKNTGHNPYFNRWFSAIGLVHRTVRANPIVTILILIDGFLQC